VRQLADRLQHRLDARLVGRVGELAVLDGDDDLLLVARRLRRGLLQQVQGIEAVGAAELELVLVVAAGTRVDGDQDDERGDPAAETDPWGLRGGSRRRPWIDAVREP
jgi:hypothetical protein